MGNRVGNGQEQAEKAIRGFLSEAGRRDTTPVVPQEGCGTDVMFAVGIGLLGIIQRRGGRYSIFVSGVRRSRRRIGTSGLLRPFAPAAPGSGPQPRSNLEGPEPSVGLRQGPVRGRAGGSSCVAPDERNGTDSLQEALLRKLELAVEPKEAPPCEEAREWCDTSSGQARKNGGKPRTYVLISHAAIEENMTIRTLQPCHSLSSREK